MAAKADISGERRIGELEQVDRDMLPVELRNTERTNSIPNGDRFDRCVNH